MSDAHGDFVWYELLTSDIEAARKFYSGLIGWSFANAGMEGMEYILFKADGPEVGGLLTLTDEMKTSGAVPAWSGYIHVDDVDACVSAITGAGGKVVLDPWNIPDVGRLAYVADTTGAMFYIIHTISKESSESFAKQEPRVGHCAWNELMTADSESANTFYSKVFGWTKSESMDMGPMGKYHLYRNGADSTYLLAGMMQKPDEMPVSAWAYYFRVPDIDTAVAYIGENGGKVMFDPIQVPGGDFAIGAVDPQGAMFSLIGSR